MLQQIQPVFLTTSASPAPWQDSKVRQAFCDKLAREGITAEPIEIASPKAWQEVTSKLLRNTSLSHVLWISDNYFLDIDFSHFGRHALGQENTIALSLSDKPSDLSVQLDTPWRIQSIGPGSDESADMWQSCGVFVTGRQTLEKIASHAAPHSTQEFLQMLLQMPAQGLPALGEVAPWSQGSPAKWQEQRRPCLFLDRDGIIIEDTAYPYKPSDFRFIPATLELIKAAKKKGWWCVVVTNQAGVARGKFTLADYQSGETFLDTELKKMGVPIDRWFHCPYLEDTPVTAFSRRSFRRKPWPGMVMDACAALPIDINKSLMIGDKESDALWLPGLKSMVLNPLTDHEKLSAARTFVG